MMVSDEKYKRNQTEPDTADEVEELKAFVSTIRQTKFVTIKIVYEIFPRGHHIQ
jgi:hypothetical protein